MHGFCQRGEKFSPILRNRYFFSLCNDWILGICILLAQTFKMKIQQKVWSRGEVGAKMWNFPKLQDLLTKIEKSSGKTAKSLQKQTTHKHKFCENKHTHNAPFLEPAKQSRHPSKHLGGGVWSPYQLSPSFP